MYEVALATGPTMRRLQREMDRLFTGMIAPESDVRAAAPGRAAMFPPLNVWETDQGYFVEAELPGFTMDKLDISLLGQDLTIKGERAEPAHERATLHRRERAFGAFARTVRLPGEIDAGRVSAKLTAGVLTIELPKSEAMRPRHIKVNGG